MSFVLTNSVSQQLSLVQSTLQHWTEHDRDVVFLTCDREKLYSSRKFLSMFSNMFRNILNDVKQGVSEMMIIQVPVNFDCMEALISLLARGVSKYVDKDELFAAAAAINVDNVTEETVSVSNERYNSTDLNLFAVTDKKNSDLKIEIEDEEPKSID